MLVNEITQTPIGEIPADWGVMPLMRLILKTSQCNPELRPNEEFKYIDVSSVSNKTNIVSGFNLLQGKEAPSRARKIVKSGDTLFATVRPYLRNIAQVPADIPDAICSTGFCVIRANQELADPDFLFYTVLQDSFVERVVDLQRGSSYPAVSDKDIYGQVVAVPPPAEQRRIAAALNAIQAEIAAQEDIIVAAREFKRSLMQRLFTYGAGAEPAETKETEIGEIPAHWEIKTIGELCDENGGLVQTGPFGSLLHSSDYVDTGIPSVMPQDIIDNRISTINIARISESDHARLERYHLQTGDIIYARRGDIGRRALVTDKENGWLCGTGSLFIRLNNPRIHSTYLHHYLGLSPVTDFVLARAVGSTMLNLNTTILKSVPIAFAETCEQEAIAEMLDSADSKIATEEDRKTALQDFFKTMLHQLMTGQIRLLSDEGLPL